jgi:hypothetical protein
MPVPSEVSGQLVAGDERDWFAIQARRGEVLFIEALGQRIGSPVDLQISVLDTTGQRELTQFGDEMRNTVVRSRPVTWILPGGVVQLTDAI